MLFPPKNARGHDPAKLDELRELDSRYITLILASVSIMTRGKEHEAAGDLRTAMAMYGVAQDVDTSAEEVHVQIIALMQELAGPVPGFRWSDLVTAARKAAEQRSIPGAPQ